MWLFITTIVVLIFDTNGTTSFYWIILGHDDGFSNFNFCHKYLLKSIDILNNCPRFKYNSSSAFVY